MVRFGLVGEGITDQIVLENILGGYFNTADILVDSLQPTRDATDENKMSNSGNWHKVMTYCQSDNFREALINNGEEYYIIIQIDTDIFWGDSVGAPYSVPTRNENGEIGSEELLFSVVLKLIELIGEQFYIQYQKQIIFAVSVNQLECWLLPLYVDKKKSHKDRNCLSTLNSGLKKKEGFTIDTKNPSYYRHASKNYRKNKILLKNYRHNISFEGFIQQLEERTIVIEQEEDW
ncbi:MAG: phage tail protein [Aureispira sp.]